MESNAPHITKSPELGFSAHRGIGQGESASSLLWVALYDILLDYIDPRNTHLHQDEEHPTPFTQADIDHTIINAYADDLATITGGPRAAEMQQQQATWLSAFCAFTGLTMHPAKITATTLGPPPPTPPSLEIYDSMWQPVACPVNPDTQTVKYLGINIDLRHHQQAHFDRTYEDMNTHLDHLLLQPGSPQGKIDYIRNKVLPITRYSAMVANWTLAQYRDLDRPCTRAYRKILALPNKFPAALIYLPKNQCGIGLPRLSDAAQVMKWKNFQKCI